MSQREIARKDKVTIELSALLVLIKIAGDLGGQGKLISDQDRREAYELITEAVNDGASLPKACRCLGLTDRAFRNWRKQITEGKELKDGRQDRFNFKPRNALSEEERKTLIEL